MWSYGGEEQDENENVAINSPETVAAVQFMKELYEGAMTEEVFAWNPASNNQGLVGGKLSYIVNSISAYRTTQKVNPQQANDTLFVKALEGPADALAAQHVMYNWIVPEHAENHARATWESELYDFPAYPKRVPQLNDWLDNDPFGSEPPDKLAVLKDALDWSTNVGRPGNSNTAIGEVFGTFIVPNMYASAARGRQSPEDAVARAEAQMKPIFAKWRNKGLIGGAA